MRHAMHRPGRDRPLHPGEGEIRAYLDGELTPVAALRLAVHTRRFAACARIVADLRSLDARTTSLLSTLVPGPGRRPPRYGRGVGIVCAGVLAAGALMIWIGTVPSTHARDTGAYRVHDVCCFNLDGGAHADDGMLTVSRPGEVVDCVLLYEDRAGLRRFAAHDPLRFTGGDAASPACGSEVVSDLTSSVSARERGL